MTEAVLSSAAGMQGMRAGLFLDVAEILALAVLKESVAYWYLQFYGVPNVEWELEQPGIAWEQPLMRACCPNVLL